MQQCGSVQRPPTTASPLQHRRDVGRVGLHHQQELGAGQGLREKSAHAIPSNKENVSSETKYAQLRNDIQIPRK